MKRFYWLGTFILCALVVATAVDQGEAVAGVYYLSGGRTFSPPPDTEHGLIGSYYNDDPDNSEKFDTLKMQRIDSVIQFDWGDGSPDPGVVGNQNNDFSIRWVGLIKAPVTGTYTFHTWTDDGARVTINGQKIIDYWGSCCSDHSGSIDLEAGRLYPLVFEMHEGGGGAAARYLDWVIPGREQQLVSSQYLYAVVPKKVSRPALLPEPHLYEGMATVTMFTYTSGATVHYTLDGSDPTPSSPVYDTAIDITASSLLRIRAFKNGMYPSDIVSGYYTIIPPLVTTPVFKPTQGVYGDPQMVSISTADTGTVIYYTVDGSIPTTLSPVYTGPFEVDSTTRVKALATREDRTPSKIASATYTMLPPAARPPEFSVPAGTYDQPQQVSITSPTPGGVIHYALNDAPLNEASPVYSDPIAISKTTTLKAYVKKEGLRASDVTVADYIVGHSGDTVAAPTFSTPGGHYNGILQVALSTTTQDAKIYFTTDGSDPTESSSAFFAPVIVTDSTVIRAYAAKDGLKPSRVVSATYVVAGLARDTSAITDKIPKPELVVSPNPASDQVRISWSNMLYTLDGTYVTVTDSKGVVMKRIVIKGGYTYYIMNTTNFADGVYYIKVQSGRSVALGKVIIGR